MIAIGIKGYLNPLQRAMVTLRAEQVPFAMSLALNNLAKGVAAEERKLIDQTFDTPTPFTENAYRIQVATKKKPIAIVAAKDIQASYLEPYVDGGNRSLSKKKGMLAPRAIGLNQYGNLPRTKLKTLQGKPGVFIGAIKTRRGAVINGVWQKPRSTGRRGGKRVKGEHTRSPLKLLIQFEDTTPVPKRLPFEERARQYLARHAAGEFDAALRRAMATARR